VNMTGTVIDNAIISELKETTGSEFMVELIDTFLADAPGMLADLHKALAENNAELFRRSAHSLKSNSGTFGALALAALARELENLGRNNQFAGTEDRLAQLEVEYGKVELALKSLCES
jgi:HPt (histidine-containing phosphotransfer) domain-containing protein